MVTDGGSSKRVGIWINWGVGGEGNYTTLLTYFAVGKGLKVKCQEYRSGSRECNVWEARGLDPCSPFRQHITATWRGDFIPSLHRLSRNVVTVLRHVLLSLFDSYLTAYIFF